MTSSVQRVVADVSQKDVQLSFDARYDGTDDLRRPRCSRRLRTDRSKAADASRWPAIDRSPSDLRAQAIQSGTLRRLPGRLDRRDDRRQRHGLADDRRARPTSPSHRAAGSRDSPTQGRVRGRFAPASVQALVADVTLGANRVQASGALGSRRRPPDARRSLRSVWRSSTRCFPPTCRSRSPAAFDGDGDARDARARRAPRMSTRAHRSSNAGNEWQFATLAIAGRATHAAPLSQPAHRRAAGRVAGRRKRRVRHTPAGHADRARVVARRQRGCAHSCRSQRATAKPAWTARLSASLAGSGSTSSGAVASSG